MSGREKPDAPGLWRDANEKTVVACMESGELAIRDAVFGMWIIAFAIVGLLVWTVVS